MSQVACRHCGSLFSGKQGKRYCCRNCKELARRAAQWPEPVLRLCTECAKSFLPSRADQLACSPKCRASRNVRLRPPRKHNASCEICGQPYHSRKNGNGRFSRTCSRQCGECLKHLETYGPPSTAVIWASRTGCHTTFIVRHGRRLHDCDAMGCLQAERKYAELRRLTALARSQPRPCVECGAIFTPARFSTQRYCSKRCVTRAGRRLRKARLRSAHQHTHLEAAVPITLHAIGTRDDWTCHLCDEPVDPSLRVPDDWAPTIDHVIPIAVGGAHTYRNVKLAHFWCNSVRGAHDIANTRQLLAN